MKDLLGEINIETFILQTVNYIVKALEKQNSTTTRL